MDMRLAMRIGCAWFELEFGSCAPNPSRYRVVPDRGRFRLQRKLLRRIQACFRAGQRGGT